MSVYLGAQQPQSREKQNVPGAQQPQAHGNGETVTVDIPNAHEVWVTHPRNPELEKIHLAHGSTSWLYKT